MGHPRRDVDQSAVARNDPLPDLAGVGFPGEDGASVEGIEILRLAGVKVVAAAVAREDGNEMEGRSGSPGAWSRPCQGKKLMPRSSALISPLRLMK